MAVKVECPTDKIKVDRRWHKTKAIEALESHGFSDVASRLKDCRPGNHCSSPYCFSCRDRLVSCQTQKVLRVYHNRYSDDEALGRKEVYFLTILHDLCELDHEKVKDALIRGKKALASLRRSFDGLLTYGRCELEAVDMDVIFGERPCFKKAIALKSLNGNREETSASTMGLFHSHILVFLNGHDAKEVRQRLGVMFPGPYRVELRPLRKDKSVDDSLRDICGYILKSATQYNYSMESRISRNGRIIDDDALISLIRFGMSDEIGVSSFLIYSKGNGMGGNGRHS